MKVLLSGGGTGGHVYPILAVVSVLRQPASSAGHEPSAEPAWRHALSARSATGASPASETKAPANRSRLDAAGPPSAALPAVDAGRDTPEYDRHLNFTQSGATEAPEPELRYVGEAGGIEEALAGRAGISFAAVATGQMRGRAPWTMAANGVRMAQGVRQCATLLRAYRPDVILVTGGYVTVPLALAAWRRVPLLIYLPDLTPGLAIRWTSRLATKVAVSFPEAAGYFPGKAVVTGYPVRPELLAADKQAARAAFGLRLGRSGTGDEIPLVLVFGGSRGARSINRALVDALPKLLPHCEVLHVSGQLDWSWVAEAAARLPEELRERYHPFPYLHDEMVPALAAADLAVARAGASTLGEFPARGLPSILVPYPYAGQHQMANAEYLAERGAALIVQDAELAARLGPMVLDLVGNPARLRGMGQAASALARPQAAAELAKLLYELAGR